MRLWSSFTFKKGLKMLLISSCSLFDHIFISTVCDERLSIILKTFFFNTSCFVSKSTHYLLWCYALIQLCGFGRVYFQKSFKKGFLFSPFLHLTTFASSLFVTDVFWIFYDHWILDRIPQLHRGLHLYVRCRYICFVWLIFGSKHVFVVCFCVYRRMIYEHHICKILTNITVKTLHIFTYVLACPWFNYDTFQISLNFSSI